MNLNASLIIGADGVRSTVAAQVDAPVIWQGSTESAVLYRYFTGLPAAGYEWAYGEGAAAGLIPTNDATCVFVATTPARMRFLRSSGAERAFSVLVALAAPAVADRIADATPATELRGWAGEPGYSRRCWGDGWALVGDAGYFKDPITTHGMTDALRDAELLADSILALLSGCEAASVMPAYERTRDRLSRDMFDVTGTVAGYDWNLNEVRHVASVKVQLTLAGAKAQLRTGGADPGDSTSGDAKINDTYTSIGEVQTIGKNTVFPVDMKAQYLLIWFTELPLENAGSANPFKIGVEEISVEVQ